MTNEEITKLEKMLKSLEFFTKHTFTILRECDYYEREKVTPRFVDYTMLHLKRILLELDEIKLGVKIKKSMD